MKTVMIEKGPVLYFGTPDQILAHMDELDQVFGIPRTGEERDRFKSELVRLTSYELACLGQPQGEVYYWQPAIAPPICLQDSPRWDNETPDGYDYDRYH